MRPIDPALQAHLNTGTTTLCYCWRLTLASGEAMGFTDHDRALIFDSTTFEAQAGFTSSEIESSLGLSVDNLEADGALSSTKLSALRLQSGDFDNATIEIWTVNWQIPTQRLLERKGNLGQVTYGQGAFKAEVRGLAHLLNQRRGRLFQHGCDAQFGDARCAASAAAFTANALVSSAYGARLNVSGLGSYADDWFTRGRLNFTSTANRGRVLDIKRHRVLATGVEIDLWMAPKFLVSVGETVSLVAGCDKQLATCTSKFSNAVNFRGFPHMPGNDFVSKVAAQSDPNNNGLKR